MIRREDLPPLPPHPCKPECAERTWECKRSCPRFAAWQAIKDKYEEYGTQEWKRNTLVCEQVEMSMRKHRVILKTTAR